MCRESRRQVARKVRVTDKTPRTLWSRQVTGNAPENSKNIGQKRTSSNANPATELLGCTKDRKAPSSSSVYVKAVATRVPLVRAIGIAWNLSSKELLAPGFRWPEGVKNLEFWAKFEDSVEVLNFPVTLEALSFGFWFNQSFEPGRVRWPPAMKRLKLGTKWNRRLRGAKESWPASLEALQFGSGFNKPLAGSGAGLPPSLREISLGGAFNQPVKGVEWPPGLRKLVFSDSFNQSLEGACFPSGLREISFGLKFDQEIKNAVWPKELKFLKLGHEFNRAFASPERLEWEGAGCSPSHLLPSGLKVLVLGDTFDQPMKGSELPDRLEHLVIGKSFAFVSSVCWPSGLRRLELACPWGNITSRSNPLPMPANLEVLDTGNRFNSPLSNFAFPSSLKVLVLGSEFNKHLDRCEREVERPLLPGSIEELRLGAAFNRDIENTRLPKSLKRLTFTADSKFDRSVARVAWPASLEELTFGNCFNQEIEGSTLPGSLRKLQFGWSFAYSLQGVELPDGLQELSFHKRYPLSHVRGLVWPPCLRSIFLGAFRFRCREDLAKWAAQQVPF